MSTPTTKKGSMDPQADASAEAEEKAERTYTVESNGEPLAFDPLRDLNLPSSYDEVRSRFGRLQGLRKGPALN